MFHLLHEILIEKKYNFQPTKFPRICWCNSGREQQWSQRTDVAQFRGSSGMEWGQFTLFPHVRTGSTNRALPHAASSPNGPAEPDERHFIPSKRRGDLFVWEFLLNDLRFTCFLSQVIHEEESEASLADDSSTSASSTTTTTVMEPPRMPDLSASTHMRNMLAEAMEEQSSSHSSEQSSQTAGRDQNSPVSSVR